MHPRASSAARQIARYLRTGETGDPLASAWPGQNILERGAAARQGLLDALLAEIRRRTPDPRPEPTALHGLDVMAFTRRKIEPMIRGLFPRSEQDALLTLLERSVFFVGPATIEPILRGARLCTAWDIANLYLDSVGATLLSRRAPRILGLSEDTSCFVSMTYFEALRPFDDFLVHEVAHIFHNCKRSTVGFRRTRRHEWLLDIDFEKRETFAYSCEAYARILEDGRGTRERIELAARFTETFRPAEARMDPAEVVDIVQEAVRRRNGWKSILARCAPPARHSQDRIEDVAARC